MAKQSKEQLAAALEARKQAYLEDAKKIKARLNAIEAKERQAANRARNHVLILIGAAIINSDHRDQIIGEAVKLMKPKDAENVQAYIKALKLLVKAKTPKT